MIDVLVSAAGRGGRRVTLRPSGDPAHTERPRVVGASGRYPGGAGGCRRAARGARSGRSPGRGRTPRAAGRGRGRARAEVREDPVRHRRLRDAGDDAHGAMAGRAREGIDFKDLLPERCRSAAGAPPTGGWPRGARVVPRGRSAAAPPWPTGLRAQYRASRVRAGWRRRDRPPGPRHPRPARGPPHGLSIAPTPRPRAGTCGVRDGPTAASHQSPPATGPTGTAQPRAREPRQRGGGHAATRPSGLVPSAIGWSTRPTPIEIPMLRYGLSMAGPGVSRALSRARGAHRHQGSRSGGEPERGVTGRGVCPDRWSGRETPDSRGCTSQLHVTTGTLAPPTHPRRLRRWRDGAERRPGGGLRRRRWLAAGGAGSPGPQGDALAVPPGASESGRSPRAR